jgi:hypothetical protein
MFFRHCVFDDHIRWWKILDREIHVWGDVINCEKEAFFYVMKIIPPTVWAPPPPSNQPFLHTLTQRKGQPCRQRYFSPLTGASCAANNRIMVFTDTVSVRI